ncbi:MAG: hypothetical protein Q4A82_01025 [Corynebacterium sp.]|nr:hypothetical protein [Corynebacterium sp.]
MSGPPRKPHGASRTKGASHYVVAFLPAAGRQGKTPAWPLDGAAPEGWAELWRCPQAVMWEKNGSYLAVARYLKLRNLVHSLTALAVKPAWYTELRNTEDALGLSPKGMQNLRWQITTDDIVNEEPGAPGDDFVSSIDERRRRMQIVDEGAG